MEPVRILHVDDEPDFADLTAIHLERERDDFEVVTATSATEGLEHLAESDIDCIVSDYDMPGMDGLEFLETVREEYPDLPFVLFTGRGGEEIASEAITAGVTGYLNKGSGTDQYTVLANRIDNAVSQYRAEHDLRSSTERLRKLYGGITDAIFVLDTDWRFTHLNGRAEEIFERTEAEVIGENVWDVFPEAVDTTFQQQYEKAMDQRIPVEFETFYPPLDVWVEVRAAPTENGLTAHFRDISSKKDRERELERSEDLLDKTQQMASVGGWELDRRENELRWTDETKRIHDLGLDYDPDLDEAIDFYHPEDRPIIEDTVSRAIEAGERFDEELRIVTATGNQRWVRTLGEPQRENGETVMLRGTTQDITEMKAQERELQRRNERLKTIVENAPVVLFALDDEGVFTLSEGRGLEGLGIEFGELVGQSVFDRYAGTQIAEDARRAIDGEAVHSTVDVGDRAFETWYEPVTNGTETDYRAIGVAVDITDLKEREEELRRQNERLDEFANVVSHDLRNPLGIAQGYLELARENGDDKAFAKIETAHQRMEVIIDDVLTLARQGQRVGETQPVSLPSTVEAAWGAVETDGAELMNGEGLGTIDADDGRLEALFENLFRNAIEHGGENVTVRVGRSPTEFYVEDDGPGIPEDEREQVFDHGHTTSESGTGFGLPIVEQIADAHGWDVVISEGADSGARFEVHL